MNRNANNVPEQKRKLLGFTDNRQDAALQAGHFNDFLFVSLLRAALLSALKKAGKNGLTDEEFGSSIQAALGFQKENVERRNEWMADPSIKGVGLDNASKNLTRVLSHRVWADQRRGWRYTNPNLEQLELIGAEYLSLDELVLDAELFENGPSEIKSAAPERRKEAFEILFNAMRTGLAVSTEALDATYMESVGTAARQSLKEPWSIGVRRQINLDFVQPD